MARDRHEGTLGRFQRRVRLRRKSELANRNDGIWEITELGRERLSSVREIVPHLDVLQLRKLLRDRRPHFYADVVEMLAKVRADGYEI